MKNALAKKIIIIFSVILVVVLSAVLIAVVSGNTKTPALSDPDGVFYQRTDDQGNVIYTITNEELFEEIKSNDGLEQLLYVIDEYLLQDYVAQLSAQEIADKILELTYGTADAAEIAAMEAATKTDLETAYAQSMALAGYTGNEEAYARITLAREAYVRYRIDVDGDVTDMEVAAEYVNNTFDDIQAIKIRFTSAADATFVMHEFNLLTYASTSLRSYLGYYFTLESLKDGKGTTDTADDTIVQAYTTVNPFYFDPSGNIVNLSDAIVYTKGTNDIYTDKATTPNEYTLDDEGNLLNASLAIAVSKDLLFTTKALASTYKTDNTEYFTVTKTDPFDTGEDAQVKNAADEVVYTIDADGKIWEGAVDVTDTTDLIVNKHYADISKVTTVSVNNSASMTNDEVLAAYIKMYNYVYGGYRTALPEDATPVQLVTLGDAYLTHNFATINAFQASLAKYMFDTLDLTNSSALPYSVLGKSYAGTNDTSYYMVYKLTQPSKVDAYEIMLDYVEDRIVPQVPTTVAGNITLPTTDTWYGAKITWTSGNTVLLANNGTYTAPTENTLVVLTYKITANSISRTGTINVTVLPSGETGAVTAPSATAAIAFETILNNSGVYHTLYQKLIDAMMVDKDNAEATVNGKLSALRSDAGMEIYDYYLGMDYTQIDSAFVTVEKGHKTNLAKVNGRPGYLGASGTDGELVITADDLLTTCIAKNAALYTLYAVQYKEMVYSSFFEDLFGTQKNIERNKTDKMADMYASVDSVKSYYIYLQQLYAQYNIAFTYGSFTEYAYLQYGTRTELELLKYFVEGAMQPYFINEAIEEYDLIQLFENTVKDYYDNYFSLSVNHLIISVDFNEDGSPDDFDEYIGAMTPLDKQTIFDARIADFEIEINDYLNALDTNTFATLVTAYNAASREDETWGRFKQYGFVLITEKLDIKDVDDAKDASDNTILHSLTYSGTYGVKDSYVQEYVDALVALYQEYQLPQNADAADLMSGLVQTVYGLHLILATQGDPEIDHFARFSALFAEANPAVPVYTAGSENPDGCPTLEQMQLYAKYFFYKTAYDLTDSTIEATYGITVPDIPASVSSALEFYFDDLLSGVYVVGTVNIRIADRILAGSFVANDYSALTDAQIKAGLGIVRNVYYEALFAKYE